MIESLESATHDLHRMKVKHLKELGFEADTLYIDIHESDRFAKWSKALNCKVKPNDSTTSVTTRWKKPLKVKCTYIGDMMGDVVYVAPEFESIIGFEWKSLSDFRSSVQHDSGNRLSRQLCNMKTCYDAVRLIVDESKPLINKRGRADDQTYARIMSTLSTYNDYYGQVHRRKTTNNCIHKVIEYVGAIRSGKPSIILRESPVVERHDASLDPFIIHNVVGKKLAVKLKEEFKSVALMLDEMEYYALTFGDRQCAIQFYEKRLDVEFPDLKIGFKIASKIYKAFFDLDIIEIPFGHNVCMKYAEGTLKGKKRDEVGYWIEKGYRQTEESK